MKNAEWMDSKTACTMLGVKPQTLYSYVSRHNVRVKTDPRDARASLYSRFDIEHLTQQARRSRAREDIAQAAIRWGDPVLRTSISEVREGSIWLRGRRIESCAREMSLESVAALLCGFEVVDCPPASDTFSGTSAFSRALKALAHETETAKPLHDLNRTEACQETGRLLSVVTTACLGQSHNGLIHERIASAWNL